MGLLRDDPPEALRRYRTLMGQEVGDEERYAIRVTAPRGRKACDAVSRGPAPRPAVQTLEQIIAEVAAELGMPADSITTRAHQAKLVRARAEIARRALRAGVATLSQVAARLGRAPSTMSELLRCR